MILATSSQTLLSANVNYCSNHVFQWDTSIKYIIASLWVAAMNINNVLNFFPTAAITRQFIWSSHSTLMQRRPSPLRPWCISPLFQISPHFRKIFGLSGKFWQFYLFPKNFLTFIRQISDDLFLVIDHKFRISSPTIFSLYQYISPLFRENYSFPPTFTNSPLF